MPNGLNLSAWYLGFKDEKDIGSAFKELSLGDDTIINNYKPKNHCNRCKRVEEISSSWRTWGLMEKMVSESDLEGYNCDKFKEN